MTTTKKHWQRKPMCRLFRERQHRSYILVQDVNGKNHYGHTDAIGNVFSGSNPSLATCNVSDAYLRNRCKRVEWSELPKIWQDAFLWWMREWDTPDPKQIKGFWRV